jgi:hypothetical protein
MKMVHNFRVGEEYANRLGKYRVLSIDDPTITVQYADQRILKADITTLARIWENMQAEAGPDRVPEEPKAAPRTATSTRTRRATKPTGAA